jgi:hypothetical protein
MIMSPAAANDQYWPCGGGFYTVAISPCGAAQIASQRISRCMYLHSYGTLYPRPPQNTPRSPTAQLRVKTRTVRLCLSGESLRRLLTNDNLTDGELP